MRDKLNHADHPLIKAALAATLPDGYVWGADATECFDMGKERAAAAIDALIEQHVKHGNALALDDLTKHRWLTVSDDPNDFLPITPLLIAADEIQSGKVDASHVIIIIDRRDKESVYVKQAGERDFIGSMGLLERAKQILYGEPTE